MLVGMSDTGCTSFTAPTNPDEVDVLATSTAKAVFYSAVTTILSSNAGLRRAHRGSLRWVSCDHRRRHHAGFLRRLCSQPWLEWMIEDGAPVNSPDDRWSED